MKTRMQYAHPDRVRQPAKTKPRGPFVRLDPFRGPVIVYPPKIGGERGKYRPHQGKAEMARRMRMVSA